MRRKWGRVSWKWWWIMQEMKESLQEYVFINFFIIITYYFFLHFVDLFIRLMQLKMCLQSVCVSVLFRGIKTLKGTRNAIQFLYVIDFYYRMLCFENKMCIIYSYFTETQNIFCYITIYWEKLCVVCFLCYDISNIMRLVCT